MVVVPAEKIADRVSLGANTHTIKTSQYTGRRYTSPAYMDISKGKENCRLANYTEYRNKLHEFYRRQAIHHLDNPDDDATHLPGFPDLDGGIHGHHPTYHKNGVSSEIRDAADQGNVLQYVGPNRHYGFRLGTDRDWLLVYDTNRGQPLRLLKNGDVDYDDYRYSTARQAKTIGNVHHEWTTGSWGKAPFHFNGHYRHDGEAVPSYRIGEDEIRETFRVENVGEIDTILVQSLHFPGSAPTEPYNIAGVTSKGASVSRHGGLTVVVSKPSSDRATLIAVDLEAEGGSVRVDEETGTVSVRFGRRREASVASVVHWTGDAKKLDRIREHVLAGRERFTAAARGIPSMLTGSKGQWPHVLAGHGEVAEDSAPYVIDTLPIPLVNPYRAPMFLSGITFDEDGVAYVCTLFGEVWKVTGIDRDLKNVRWKRMIAGLNSTLGILYHEGTLFVGDKAELLALHDLNGDDEFDFVERRNQAFDNFGRNVHAGLVADDDGAFYYITAKGLARLADDRYEVFAPPLRTAMGVGITHDNRVWAAPQEGDGTPASAIFEFHEGDDLYRPTFRGSDEDVEREREMLDPALVYLPRGVDNSTACSLAVSSDRFGPIDGKMLNFSYGACATQLVLRDKPPGATRYQGAAVPIPGNFFSGANHGAVNPKDGQVYVVGHDGWGTYAISDGSLQRLRYTGQPAYYPVGFRLHTNGIRIDFDRPLSKDAVADARNVFAQQWNYIYSAAYGSPEYSVRNPDRTGHDRLAIRSRHPLADGKSIFVEIPDLQPSMTTHLFGRLKGADGEPFELNVFMTGLFLAKAFDGHLDTPLPREVAEATRTLTLPFSAKRAKASPITAADRKGAKTVEVTVDDGLKFQIHSRDTDAFRTLVAGEKVVFTVRNTSKGGMGHNAVIVKREDAEPIGRASDAIVGDPRALENAYVPKFVEGMEGKVLAHSIIVPPADHREFLFRADEAGTYTMLCTFPGHWRIMQLDFEVYESPELASQGEAERVAREAMKLEPILLKETFDVLAADARTFGDIERGRALFYTGKVGCAACHDPAKGRPLGPNLLEKREVKDTFLVESILNPSKSIRKGYQPTHVVTDVGRSLVGFRLLEDDDTLVLRDAVLGKSHEFRKRELEHVMQMTTSTMPKGLANQLRNRAEFLDLVRFVMEAATGRFSTRAETSLRDRKDIAHLPGQKDAPHVLFLVAEPEYGSHDSMPMLARILNERFGYTVSIGFSLDERGEIDTNARTNLSGIDLLPEADLVVLFARWRVLPEPELNKIVAYLRSGRPVVGFRTANHAFNYREELKHLSDDWSPRGEKISALFAHRFFGHHRGGRGKEYLTEAVVNVEQAKHSILRGVTGFKDPRHLYNMGPMGENEAVDATVLMTGKVLHADMVKPPHAPVQPTVIVREAHTFDGGKPFRMFYSSLAGSDTFENPVARRVALQGMFWALGREDEIPPAGLNVDLVGPYQTSKEHQYEFGTPASRIHTSHAPTGREPSVRD